MMPRIFLPLLSCARAASTELKSRKDRTKQIEAQKTKLRARIIKPFSIAKICERTRCDASSRAEQRVAAIYCGVAVVFLTAGLRAGVAAVSEVVPDRESP